MTATHDIVIKSDRRGRLRFTREQHAAMLEAYDAGGLSGLRCGVLRRTQKSGHEVAGVSYEVGVGRKG